MVVVEMGCCSQCVVKDQFGKLDGMMKVVQLFMCCFVGVFEMFVGNGGYFLIVEIVFFFFDLGIFWLDDVFGM